MLPSLVFITESSLGLVFKSMTSVPEAIFSFFSRIGFPKLGGSWALPSGPFGRVFKSIGFPSGPLGMSFISIGFPSLPRGRIVGFTVGGRVFGLIGFPSWSKISLPSLSLGSSFGSTPTGISFGSIGFPSLSLGRSSGPKILPSLVIIGFPSAPFGMSLRLRGSPLDVLGRFAGLIGFPF